MSKINHIYPIDKVNEFIRKKYKNRFNIIIYNINDFYHSGAFVKVLLFNNEYRNLHINKKTIKRISIKIKLEALRDKGKDNYTFEEKIKLNKLRISSLKIQHKYIKRTTNNTAKLRQSNKSKRQKLARENRSCGKQKNK